MPATPALDSPGIAATNPAASLIPDARPGPLRWRATSDYLAYRTEGRLLVVSHTKDDKNIRLIAWQFFRVHYMAPLWSKQIPMDEYGIQRVELYTWYPNYRAELSFLLPCCR